MNGDKPVIDVKELSQMLGKSKDLIYQEARKGNIPGMIKIGQSYLFNREVVEKWLKGGGN